MRNRIFTILLCKRRPRGNRYRPDTGYDRPIQKSLRRKRNTVCRFAVMDAENPDFSGWGIWRDRIPKSDLDTAGCRACLPGMVPCAETRRSDDQSGCQLRCGRFRRYCGSSGKPCTSSDPGWSWCRSMWRHQTPASHQLIPSPLPGIWKLWDAWESREFSLTWESVNVFI